MVSFQVCSPMASLMTHWTPDIAAFPRRCPCLVVLENVRNHTPLIVASLHFLPKSQRCLPISVGTKAALQTSPPRIAIAMGRALAPFAISATPASQSISRPGMAHHPPSRDDTARSDAEAVDETVKKWPCGTQWPMCNSRRSPLR
jgi:hypothetical protein